MKRCRPFVLACVIALSLVPVAAQETPVLLFEVTVDGTVVAKPQLRVPPGGEGRLVLDKEPYDLQVRFTPTLRGDDVALAIIASSRREEIRSTLLLSRRVPVSFEWKPETGG